MSIEVKVGQVWRDKDKRRSTTIEIISIGWSNDAKLEEGEVVGLVVGTEEERIYKVERLTKRWELVATKEDVAEIVAEKLIEENVPVNEKAEPKPKHKTREQWLQAAVKELTKLYKGHEVPEVRVSVGWPGGRGKKKGVIGQCFATKTTEDSVAQIFVSPVMSNPVGVLIVLAHEMVHAIDDCVSGHKTNFVKIAKEIGFIPKWTVATEETVTDELLGKLQAIAEKLGTYPHAAIHPSDRPVVQKTYMLKVVCLENPEYFLRMTQGKLEEWGAPLCPCHHEQMELEEK